MLSPRFCAVAGLMWLMPARAQVTVQFQLKNYVDTAAIYMAGSLNGWQPNDAGAKFSAQGRLSKTVAKGSVQSFKLTRGSWQTVECQSSAADMGNRVFTANRDTLIELQVAAWKDAFGQKAKVHTASANVQLFDSAFLMTPLARKRSISVYLPPNYYHNTNQRYPVLYLQDGQNCFDAFTAAYGEWGVDETLDAYFQKLQRSMIVVAISNGADKRLNEYNPYNHQRFGKGEGKLYADFLVKTLKPAIDAHFRTLSDKSHTHVAGSSMGGLISCWALLQYPAVFGSAGIFSPAFWVAPTLQKDIAVYANGYQGKLFFYAGAKESASMVPQMDQVMDAFKKAAKADLKRLVDDEGQHNEQSWQRHFIDYLEFIL